MLDHKQTEKNQSTWEASTLTGVSRKQRENKNTCQTHQRVVVSTRITKMWHWWLNSSRIFTQALPLFVGLAVASPPCRAVFVAKTPDILHLILSLSCFSGLCTARASSDPLTLCHEMGLHGAACPSMRFSPVAIHKNPHGLDKSRRFAQAAPPHM